MRATALLSIAIILLAAIFLTSGTAFAAPGRNAVKTAAVQPMKSGAPQERAVKNQLSANRVASLISGKISALLGTGDVHNVQTCAACAVVVQ